MEYARETPWYAVVTMVFFSLLVSLRDIERDGCEVGCLCVSGGGIRGRLDELD